MDGIGKTGRVARLARAHVPSEMFIGVRAQASRATLPLNIGLGAQGGAQSNFTAYKSTRFNVLLYRFGSIEFIPDFDVLENGFHILICA
jgi:hypothetical protein